jgi:hypothetical protein
MRKFPGKRRFPYKISILEAPNPLEPASVIQRRGGGRWRARALHSIKMALWIQVRKATHRSANGWMSFAVVTGYGAPGVGEFFCPYSYMVAKPVEKSQAILFRRYWVICARKSQEVLDWLNSIDPSAYNQTLHRFLKRLIVVEYNQREISLYESTNPPP